MGRKSITYKGRGMMPQGIFQAKVENFTPGILLIGWL
jgi:hypothetical protein